MTIKDRFGVIEKTTVKQLKSATTKHRTKQHHKFHANDQHNQEESLVDNNEQHDFIHDTEVPVCNISKTLPTPNPKDFLLSGSIDDTQIYIIERKNCVSVVVIKKVVFQDGEKYISGCSNCFNINSDFLIHLEGSQMYKSNDSSRLLKCDHIAASVASILDTFGQWRPAINEIEIQDFLKDHCSWENSASFFLNEIHPSYCVAFNSIDGIIPFVLKHDKWRCVFDKYQVASKCRHGRLIEIDSDTYTTETDIEIKLTPFPILGKTKFSGNFKWLKVNCDE